METPTTFDIDANGFRLRCQDWGGHGAPILIAHATGMLAMLYRPIAQALTRSGHVYSYDQRGHGDSDRRADAVYDWEHQLADLRAVVEVLNLTGLRALGHSGGAVVLAALAVEMPQRVARLVMVEPVLMDERTSARENPLVERTINRKADFENAAAMYANFAAKRPYDTWRPDILRLYCEYGAALNSAGRWELKCRPEVEASFYRQIGRFQTLKRVLACPAPTLMIFGTRGGGSTGAAHAQLIGREMPHARLIELGEAGHLIAMEQPEMVAHLAQDFFTRE